MGYSHASNYLRDRHDRYGGISYPHRDYVIPSKRYGGRVDLSSYLKQVGWPTGYSLSFDFYNPPKEKRAGDGFVLDSSRNFSEFRGFASRRLESMLC